MIIHQLCFLLVRALVLVRALALALALVRALVDLCGRRKRVDRVGIVLKGSKEGIGLGLRLNRIKARVGWGWLRVLGGRFMVGKGWLGSQ